MGRRSLGRRVRDRLAREREDRRRVEWPADASGSGVAVVVVNYNTRALITQLVFTLCRVLPRDAVREIVVVDNRSTDDSMAYLGPLADAGIVTVIPNRHSVQHGPGLNLGVSTLATRPTPVQHVWVLDSDTLVLRPDALSASLAAHEAGGAALTAQMQEHWSLPYGVKLASVLLAPAQCWRRPIPPFRDDGEPARALQRGIIDRGLVSVDFPFLRDRYVLHLEHGTLAEVAARGERDNPLYTWATDHSRPGFEGDAEGPAILERFRAVFAEEVGVGDPAAVVAACLREARVTGLAPAPGPPDAAGSE